MDEKELMETMDDEVVQKILRALPDEITVGKVLVCLTMALAGTIAAHSQNEKHACAISDDIERFLHGQVHGQFTPSVDANVDGMTKQ